MCFVCQVRKLLMTPNNPRVVSKCLPFSQCMSFSQTLCEAYLFVRDKNIHISSLYYTACFTMDHNLPTHTTSLTLCGNILAVDLVTKAKNSLSSSYHFSHHSPRWSQNKHIYHLLNLTLHLGKCWILM